MNNCLGIINLDENESKMGELVVNRPLASVPIAGRYRIIDFVLSNMTNSGIDSIGIFAKNKSRSLIDHLTNGRPWDLHRKKDGLRVFNFGEVEPAYEDVRNFADNIEFFKHSHKKYVILTPSYMICNIDYKGIIDYHKKSKNDITIVYKKVNNGDKEFIGCDVLNFDDLNEVISVGENVGRDTEIDISMEMYILSREVFIDIVEDCIISGMYKKVKNFIHDNLDILRVGGYEFKGDLNCINSIKALYDSNMKLLNRKISKEIFKEERAIYTKVKDEAPTHYTCTSEVVNSIIANGCYIEGKVENCIIGRRVYIGKNAKLKDCVIMQNSVIGDFTILDSVIADKGTEIKKGEKLVGSHIYPLVLMKKQFL
ncbi:glucose-1-phosphate adenylyltransferase subunit GlgD [Clostridium weizhouense]|uniref:Glucose-1-phosphate adenylyltransferase subunit GlgD n=1 Tax=Clostridium weizhouense TaxID=2859781 RepID=A0ABS7ATD0_9CLOT|nr:glucose-1-phosphate adenylyltransferase subunit GlgD [Clostridium weizhouense]MBW6411921.1 glucose-1-phosphate adenylyltransferase subunit GlgD [Clostridium weizhouense]